MNLGIICIGAGPAGLFCAIQAAARGVDALVLEKTTSPGRKLLASGSGRCNLSHSGDIADFLLHYGEHGRFLKPALLGFDNADLVAFFEERGLSIIETEGGKLFPSSGRSRDVLDILLAECRVLGVGIRCGISPLGIEARQGVGFLVDLGSDRLTTDFICLATGGRSWPGTGSTGDGYRFAASLGHEIVEQGPCLTSVIVRDWAFASCSGLSLRGVPIALWREGRKLRQSSGDVLFTHRGLSGPGILDLSRHFMPGDSLKIPLGNTEPIIKSGMETLDAQASEKALLASFAAHGKRSLKSCLQGLGLPEKLAVAIIDAVKAKPETKACLVDKTTRRQVAESLSAHTFPIEALGGYEEAMATRGGVALAEVDPKTMESRLKPGLFFAGELLDIDGDTGGYNLQAAFSTGCLAGVSVARRCHKDDRPHSQS